MKKFLIILVALWAAVSCNGLDDMRGSGGQNPLDECVLPSAVQAGEEALVQWNGFTKDAKIWLVSEDGQEYEVAVKVLTDSGIMFVVPAGLPAGVYTLMLDQDGRKVLGSMDVLAADMPVTGLKVPAGVVIGEELLIEGIGFEEGCAILLVDAAGNEYEAEVSVVLSGLSVQLPREVKKGTYEMYLVQNGSWLISSSFTVYGKSGPKTLVRLDYISPYLNSSELRLSWEISREEPVTLTLSEYLLDVDGETLQAYDQYVCDEEAGVFKLEHDGFEVSNDLMMSYTRDADGVVTVADVQIYGSSKTTAFEWTYDAEGYLTGVTSANFSRSLTYSSGNLTKFWTTRFEYKDAELANHPSAPDVVWAYMAMKDTTDPFVYFPYLLGWYAKASVQLPTTIAIPSPVGTGTIKNEVTYTFDDEGYVEKMAWESEAIYFIFE